MKTLSKWRYGTETEKRLLARCRDIVLAIEPGAEVILYGSRVKGDSRPDSDYDIFILVDSPLNRKLEDRISNPGETGPALQMPDHQYAGPSGCWTIRRTIRDMCWGQHAHERVSYSGSSGCGWMSSAALGNMSLIRSSPDISQELIPVTVTNSSCAGGATPGGQMTFAEMGTDSPPG